MKPAEPNEIATLAELFQSLKSERYRRKRAVGGSKRTPLNTDQRRQVLLKTDGRCHICGGEIEAANWQADHVLAASTGGRCSAENFLPAHALCNNYRWDYLPEEFQYVLKLGVWAKTQIEKGNRLGRDMARHFLAHEGRRTARRRKAR